MGHHICVVLCASLCTLKEIGKTPKDGEGMGWENNVHSGTES